ncbi:enoyl-CoA hydratase/isomerase family protein [Belnapia sp. T6]|uniref:Enoyl-CoA hydratase/isomerase family protein n=1 Tax=Belnapia mucosa TaxID=2804532 RepID=A0ABS1V9T6_9PROT|nr:enoyl-CoA hydratase/isomerase family protein [Belnapia mucosa]MBL6458431.1 enoyl-CoA hydratase/isomerase family protein [Belnapia mucosa]
MSTDVVKFEVADYVAVVTLNRPPVNAVNAELRDRLIEIFDAATDRDDIRALVLTGQGKIFSAGADLRQRPDASVAGQYWHHNRATRETGNSIKECTKPVIAAVNGAALGAGFGLMAACDIMMASETAVFGMPEIDVGLAGGAAMLNQLLGKSFTRRLMFTGDRLPAAELYRLGVIDSVWAPEELLPAAMRMAARIAEKSPLGIKYAKNSCNFVELMSPKDAYRFEQNFTYELSKTEDAKEARTAQLEKRKPEFKGR